MSPRPDRSAPLALETETGETGTGGRSAREAKPPAPSYVSGVKLAPNAEHRVEGETETGVCRKRGRELKQDEEDMSSEGEPDAKLGSENERECGEFAPDQNFQDDEPERQEETIDQATDPFQSGPNSECERSTGEELSKITPRQSEAPAPELQVDAIRNLIEIIKMEPAEISPSLVEQAVAILADLPNQIPCHEKFVAGSFQSYFPAWAELLKDSPRKSSRSVLSWLRHGFRPRFEGIANAKQDKLKIVEAMLAKVVGTNRVRSFLTGKKPHRIEFPNHKSFYDRFQFAVGETRKNLASGAVGLWPEDAEPPVIVHPMGVVESAGKERLICNDRYLNIFLKQIPFQYDKLRDVLTFTFPGSFMATGDLKSGYFHVPIHPAYWKYFGFRIGKRIFFYKVLCFGFAQACWVFTMVMREPILELRTLGIPLSGYIDDLFTAAREFGKALRQVLFTVLLFAALGAFFGLPKCQLEPLRRLKWLGFIVDSEAERFFLTDSRLQRLLAALEEIVTQRLTSARAVAKLAGMLASAAPAVLPVSIYSRSLYEALCNKESWDSLFPTPETVVQTAAFWRENLSKYNGRRWWARPTSIEVVMDASAIGFGGFVQTESGRRFEVAGTFSQEEARRSSTEREVEGYVSALQVVTEQEPERIAGRSVLVTGDSQAGVNALTKFRSPVPFINSALKKLVELSGRFDFDVTARWIPRDNLAEADALSREPDPSDWGLSTEVFRQVTCFFSRQPATDFFASDRAHVTRVFVSKFYTPGCAGVLAQSVDWSRLVPPGQCAWVFPPPGLTSLALTLVQRFKVDALVCLSAPEGSLARTQIASIAPHAFDKVFHVPRAESSCRPSLRVPKGTRNPAFMGLQVFYIRQG